MAMARSRTVGLRASSATVAPSILLTARTALNESPPRSKKFAVTSTSAIPRTSHQAAAIALSTGVSGDFAEDTAPADAEGAGTSAVAAGTVAATADMGLVAIAAVLISSMVASSP